MIAESLIRLELLTSLPELLDRRVLATFDEFQEIVYAPDNKDHEALKGEKRNVGLRRQGHHPAQTGIPREKLAWLG